MVPFLVQGGAREKLPLLPVGVWTTECRRDFAEAFAMAAHGFVWCPPPKADPDFYHWLAETRLRCPASELVCVALFHREVAKALGPVRCQLVWEMELPEALDRELARAVDVDPHHLLSRITDMGSGSPTMHRALSSLCDVEGEPIRRASDLLGMVGKRPDATRAVWRETFGDLQPKELVDWVLLIRALALSTGRVSGCVETAMLLGIHERTLDRLALRLTGATFAQTRLGGMALKTCIARLNAVTGRARAG